MRKSELQGSFVDKGSGSGIFPDLDPVDPKRPDPDPQHWLFECASKICYSKIVKGRKGYILGKREF